MWTPQKIAAELLDVQDFDLTRLSVLQGPVQSIQKTAISNTLYCHCEI